MSVRAGYRLQTKVVQPQRPLGVAILAILGVTGCLISIGLSVLGLWVLSRLGAQFSRQLVVLSIQLVVSMIILRIHWAFWELLRWAWWANLFLTLFGILSDIAVLAYMPALSKSATQGLPQPIAQSAINLSWAIIFGSIVINIVVLFYLFNVRKTFGVGVKEERPLWEQARRH